MNIVGARIDGRLVHGQVANLWIPMLSVDRVIVIDDKVAVSDIEKSGIRMATPSKVRLSVLAAARQLKADRYASQRVLLVAKRPGVYVDLVKAGFPLEELNVGNMSQTPTTTQVTNSINVEEADVAAFDELDAAGVHLVAQMVPQKKGEEFMELLEGKVNR